MKRFILLITAIANGFFLQANNQQTNSKCEFEPIYAVMITGKDDFHKNLAMNSIQSFLAQTYPNKHLIIVNDGTYSFNDSDPELVTEIKLEKKQILGALRNIGLKQVPENGIYLQWDDDDWHHPELMEEQYNYLKSQAADGCILESQVMYCTTINSAWVNSAQSGIMGTIMCKKKGDICYPEMGVSEDTYFLSDYTQKHKVVVWKNPDFYYLRFVHGHNTWDENHFNIASRKPDCWTIDQSAMYYLSEILPLYDEIFSEKNRNN